MQRLLIVSGSAESRENIGAFFNKKQISVEAVQSGSEARVFVSGREYDIIIIDAPLPDEPSEALAIFLAESTSAGVLLLCGQKQSASVTAHVEKYGVAVMQKPVSQHLINTMVNFMDVTKKRVMGLKQENSRLLKKLDEIRLVTRAKCVLIQYLNITEEQAHKYIEKQAMDMHSTKKSIALGILSTYEN